MAGTPLRFQVFGDAVLQKPLIPAKEGIVSAAVKSGDTSLEYTLTP
jgi:hypothetical protein